MRGVPRTVGIFLFPVGSIYLGRTLLVYIAVNDPAKEGGGQIALVPTRRASRIFLMRYRRLPGHEVAMRQLRNQNEFVGVQEGPKGGRPIAVFPRDQETAANAYATRYIQVAIHGSSGQPAPNSSPDD